jgi:hypothetical protein
VYGDGQVEIAWCRGNRLRERTLLSTEQKAQLQTWAGTFAAYEYEQRDEAVADGMRVRLTFAGKGFQTVSDADRQAMLDWASALVPPPAAVKPPATEVPAHNVGTVAETRVRYVLALKDVTIYDGPGTTYEPIGPVFDGQVAWVTGQSIDGTWWRVICPDDTVGDCWVSADPVLTEPATPLGAWPIYMLASGVSVEYPVDWSPSPGGYDGTQESVWFVSLDESTEGEKQARRQRYASRGGALSSGSGQWAHRLGPGPGGGGPLAGRRTRLCPDRPEKSTPTGRRF